MPAKRFIVTLTADERAQREAVVGYDKRLTRTITITRARVLLLANQGEHGPSREDRQVVEDFPRYVPDLNLNPDEGVWVWANYGGWPTWQRATRMDCGTGW